MIGFWLSQSVIADACAQAQSPGPRSEWLADIDRAHVRFVVDRNQCASVRYRYVLAHSAGSPRFRGGIDMAERQTCAWTGASRQKYVYDVYRLILPL
jgi:hypothetical protein